MIPKKLPPAYGPFKHGDPAHVGYNKTIGQNLPYMEDPEVDTVMYHPNKTFHSGITGGSQMSASRKTQQQ